MPTKQQISGALSEIARGLSNYANIRLRQQQEKEKLEENRRRRDQAFDIGLKEKEFKYEIEDRERSETRKAKIRKGERDLLIQEEKVKKAEMDAIEKRTTKRESQAARLSSPAGLKHLWMKNPNDPSIPANYRKVFQAEFDKKVGTETDGGETEPKIGGFDQSELKDLALKRWVRMDETDKSDFDNSYRKFETEFFQTFMGPIEQIGATIDESQQFNVGDRQPSGNVRIDGMDFPLDQNIGQRGTDGQQINPNLLPGGQDARLIPEGIYNQSSAGLFSPPGARDGGQAPGAAAISQPGGISGQPPTGQDGAIDITADVDPNYLKPEEEEINFLIDKLNMGNISPEEEQRLSELIEQLGQ